MQTEPLTIDCVRYRCRNCGTLVSTPRATATRFDLDAEREGAPACPACMPRIEAQRDDTEAMLRALMWAVLDPREVADRIPLDVVRDALTADGWERERVERDYEVWISRQAPGGDVLRRIALEHSDEWHRATVLAAADTVAEPIAQSFKSQPRAIVLARWLLASLARPT